MKYSMLIREKNEHGVSCHGIREWDKSIMAGQSWIDKGETTSEVIDKIKETILEWEKNEKETGVSFKTNTQETTIESN